MKVNNRALTGENDELTRFPGESYDNILESRNVSLCGTECSNGSGIGIVIKTGKDTVISRISSHA
jgi:magnesium-transporting ATPase (P-type)